MGNTRALLPWVRETVWPRLPAQAICSPQGYFQNNHGDPGKPRDPPRQAINSGFPVLYDEAHFPTDWVNEESLSHQGKDSTCLGTWKARV